MPDIFVSRSDKNTGKTGSDSGKVLSSEAIQLNSPLQRHGRTKYPNPAENQILNKIEDNNAGNGIKSPVFHDKPLKVEISDKHKLHGHSHNPLSYFSYYPDRVEFVNREPEEHVVLFLRRHPITNIRWILTAIVMLFAPVFFLFFPLFEALPSIFQNYIIIIWYLIVFAFVFEEFLMWFFHVNIVTDERILEVDFVNIFYREMTDANIDQIQDVTVEMGGGLRTLFNFGNVVIQTASEVPKIKFESVPKPDEVAKILRDLRVEEEKEKVEGRVR